jgi:hypothetical protein
MNKSNIASHWYSSQKRIQKGTELLSGFPTSVCIKKQRKEETVAVRKGKGYGPLSDRSEILRKKHCYSQVAY